MKKAHELFQAVASTPLELAMQHNNAMGYFIPEYQRDYDWGKTNIERLYYDILNGFCRLRDSSDASAYTFLGTIILVKQRAAEPEFSGVSLEVIDGQQRITTLTLIACAICELLKAETEKTDFSQLKDKTRRWLADEIDYWQLAMFRCAVGAQSVNVINSYPFARIIRQGDSRGTDHLSSEYRSSIGKVLNAFSNYFQKNELEFKLSNVDASVPGKKIIDNYTYLRKLIFGINNAAWYEDTDCEIFDIEWLNRSQCSDLFEKHWHHFSSDGERKKSISELQANKLIHGITRALLFASYFCNCITLTRVITEDESSAFDIFDALNTTGEPLTALETLRPRVIEFEKRHRGYSGSDSEEAFNEVSVNLEQICKGRGPTRKQSETKDLIITFALYLTGEKLSRDLAQQRLYLRNQFKRASDSRSKSRLYVNNFMESLREISTFRRYYWNVDELKNIGQFHGNNTVDDVKLFIRFLIAMGNSLTLPILARYWSENLSEVGDTDFESVLRALVAFVVIRRGATGSTSGIDSDLRALMSDRAGERFHNLCKGVNQENRLATPEELRGILRSFLMDKLGELSKKSWTDKVCGNPLYKQSKELVRFMVFAAAHKAVPSDTEPGNWDKAGHVPSADDANLLTYSTWEDGRYATVEHVAPSTNTGEWPVELYTDEILRHSLGNLILLPSLENSVLGASNWKKKKLMYLALSESNLETLNDRIVQAEEVGFSIPSSLREKLERGNRLSLLDSVRKVESWNENLVIQRGKNISELCWDVVWPWLRD